MNHCFACGKAFRVNSYGLIPYHPDALTRDGQRVIVGNDCYRRIVASEGRGYKPPLGGPRLWSELHAPVEALLAAGIVRTNERRPTARTAERLGCPPGNDMQKQINTNRREVV